MTENIIPGILLSMLWQLPNLSVGTVGLWLAFARRQEHRRVSKFAVVGFGALLLSSLLFLALQLWVQFAVASGEGPQVSGILSQWNFVAYPLNLISLTAMCVAVFIDRRPSSSRRLTGEYASAA